MNNILSVVWDVNPDILKIGPITLRYYGILFVSGFVLGYWLFVKFFRKEGIPQKGDAADLLMPLLMTLLLSTLIGARLGHVLFYQPEHYFAHPIEILKVWEGGLASHGGAIGVLIGIWLYVRKYGKKNGFDIMWLLDRLVICICFAGAFIRFGNLMNSEIYGDVTTLPWGFVFVRVGETLAKHPTQLYEAFSYILLGLALLWMYWYKLDKLKKGTIFGIFLIGLFGARFLIEYIKEPQVEFEVGMSLNMGQLLSIPFIIAGVAILIWSLMKGKPAGIEKITDPVRTKPKSDGTLKYAKPKS